jgi:hypothetical protein
MIEDVMHGVVAGANERDGWLSWYQHRIGIYKQGDYIKFSYNLDGRKNDPKYEMELK